jgi:hypothetical protein
MMKRVVPLAGVLACVLLAAACSPVKHQSGEAAPAGSPAQTTAAPTARPPTTTPPTSSPPSAPATSEPRLLGPNGYGTLKLGMTERQARATGLLTDYTGKACTFAYLRDASTGEGLVWLSSANRGIIAIEAWGDVETPEGVHIGMSGADMRRAYPGWQSVDPGSTDGRGYAATANGAAIYRIVVANGKVSELTLQHPHQDCYE